MLREELLTLLYKFILLFAFLFTFGCVQVQYTSAQKNAFYIEHVPDRIGFYIRNELQNNFPSKKHEAIYSVKIIVDLQDSLYLTANTGYATKSLIRSNVEIQIIDNKTNRIVKSINRFFTENYNIDPSYFATEQNKTYAIESIARKITSNVYISLHHFVNSPEVTDTINNGNIVEEPVSENSQ